MYLLNLRLTPLQRRTYIRYIDLLESLPRTFRYIPFVIQRRQREGHKPVTLSADSRLHNALYNAWDLRSFGMWTNDAALLGDSYLSDLTMFTQDCLSLTAQISRREPISNLDYRLFRLAGSPQWKLFPPRSVPDLVHELNLRFYEFAARIRQLKYSLSEVYRDSFGLNSVVKRAMNHQTCGCHAEPTVAVALFKGESTKPWWDIDYSSTQASVMAEEYQVDIALLFRRFETVSSEIGLTLENISQHADRVILELTQATYLKQVGSLNFQLNTAMTYASQCLLLTNELKMWLPR